MALNINGRIKVKTLRTDFLEEFGLTLRVYDGRSFADEDATLASIRKGDSKGGEFSPKRNTKVGNLEDKILELFGIKTQVAGSDDSYLCDNDLTLAGALEEDEKKLDRKEKKAAKPIVEKKESSNLNDEISLALTDEEKTWLDDLWSLDEAPEAIRASKAFMMEAVKENGDSLEYASDILKGDRNVVLLAVQDSASALEYASDALKDDKEIVLAAVKTSGDSLGYASDALKNDKEVVLKAVQNWANALEYASDEIRSDSKFAIEFIQALNEKNKGVEAGRENTAGIEYFAASVFSEATVVEEMVKYTPHEFLSELNEEIFETLKQFNSIIAPAVKNEFEKDMASVLTIVNNDESVSDKFGITEILRKYNMHNFLVYSAEFELKNFPETGYTETPLWLKLRDRVEDEVLSSLSEQATSFWDYKALTQMVIPYGPYTLYSDPDKEKTREFYEGLTEHMDEIGVEDLFTAYVMEGDYFYIDEELPDVASQIINKIGDKLLAMDIESALEEMDEKVSYLPDNVKSELFKRVESLSDEKKEELYADEFIDSLGLEENNEDEGW